MVEPMPEQVSIVYDDKGVNKTIYVLPPTSNPREPSVFAFSLHKAGSVLLDRILRDLSAKVGLTYVSIMSEFFSLGLAERDIPNSTARIFLDRGYCFGGFRGLPRTFEIPRLNLRRSILLVRDPRDMVVSHYYSSRYSHPEPGKALTTSMSALPRRARATALTLDEYALDLAPFYATRLAQYMEVLEKTDSFTVFRYEDVIFEKRKWLRDICRAYGWCIGEGLTNAIADRHDVVPTTENAARHIRQVRPGDGMRKLSLATIKSLNQTLIKPLRYFGYED